MKKFILLLIAMVISLTIAIQPVYAISTSDGIAEYADKKIVFLGDSITLGVGVTDHDDRFADIVSNTLEFADYVNMGVTGSTIAIRTGFTNSFTERAPSVPVDSDYVIIFGG